MSGKALILSAIATVGLISIVPSVVNGAGAIHEYNPPPPPPPQRPAVGTAIAPGALPSPSPSVKPSPQYRVPSPAQVDAKMRRPHDLHPSGDHLFGSVSTLYQHKTRLGLFCDEKGRCADLPRGGRYFKSPE
jgi:hypothetical protein